MNKLWEQYIENINSKVENLDKEKKEIYKSYMQRNTDIEERIMRMWKELRLFELTPNDYHMFALYTIREDILDKLS